MKAIPFNRPYINLNILGKLQESFSGQETIPARDYFADALGLLCKLTGAERLFLTSSCTHALEMTAMLANIEPGDEIIMPSFTFVSSANPFVMRGGIPVFIDICPETLNMDISRIEQAITPKTKAILVVHYGGVAVDMDRVKDLTNAYRLLLLEDAAHGIGAWYKQKHLGCFGDLGCLSFDAGKNIHSFKGGALLVNRPELMERAEILLEKGTDKIRFSKGLSDYYTWLDVGSNYAMNLLNTIFLVDQLENAAYIRRRREAQWQLYATGFHRAESAGMVRIPQIPDNVDSNGHIFFLIMQNADLRNQLIKHLADEGISAVFHYVPLHSSPAGMKYGRFHGEDRITSDYSQRMLRLPLFHEMTDDEIGQVIDCVYRFLNKMKG